MFPRLKIKSELKMFVKSVDSIYSIIMISLITDGNEIVLCATKSINRVWMLGNCKVCLVLGVINMLDGIVNVGYNKY